MLFFGDNGQGDLMCAERLTGMNGSPGSPSEDGVGGMVSAAFIHQAGPDGTTQEKVFQKQRLPNFNVNPG